MPDTLPTKSENDQSDLSDYARNKEYTDFCDASSEVPSCGQSFNAAWERCKRSARAELSKLRAENERLRAIEIEHAVLMRALETVIEAYQTLSSFLPGNSALQPGGEK